MLKRTTKAQEVPAQGLPQAKRRLRTAAPGPGPHCGRQQPGSSQAFGHLRPHWGLPAAEGSPHAHLGSTSPGPADTVSSKLTPNPASTHSYLW